MLSALRSSIDGPIPLPDAPDSFESQQRAIEDCAQQCAARIEAGQCTLSDDVRAILGLNGETSRLSILKGLQRLPATKRQHVMDELLQEESLTAR